MPLTFQEIEEALPVAPKTATIDITGITTLDLDQYADITIINSGIQPGYIAWLTYTGLSGSLNPGDTITGSGGATGVIYVVGPTDTVAYFVDEGSDKLYNGDTFTTSGGAAGTVNQGYGTSAPYDDVWIPTVRVGVFQVGEECIESVTNAHFIILADDGTTMSVIQNSPGSALGGSHPITGQTSGATAVSPALNGGSWWGYFNQYAPAEMVTGQISGATGIVVGDASTGTFHLTTISGVFQFPEPLVGATSGLLVKAWTPSSQYSNQNKERISLTDYFDANWIVTPNVEAINSIVGMNQGVFPVTLVAASNPLQITIQHTAVATATPGDIVLENDTDVVLTGRTTRGDFIILNNAESNDIVGQEGGAVY